MGPLRNCLSHMRRLPRQCGKQQLEPEHLLQTVMCTVELSLLSKRNASRCLVGFDASAQAPSTPLLQPTPHSLNSILERTKLKSPPSPQPNCLLVSTLSSHAKIPLHSAVSVIFAQNGGRRGQQRHSPPAGPGTHQQPGVRCTLLSLVAGVVAKDQWTWN